jgi:hypothetical protein
MDELLEMVWEDRVSGTEDVEADMLDAMDDPWFDDEILDEDLGDLDD